MSATLPRSHWWARRRRPGPLSSTKVQRENKLNLFKWDGCCSFCGPRSVAAAPESAAEADWFVESRIHGRDDRHQAGATLGKPCCSFLVHKSAGRSRKTMARDKGRREPVCALFAVVLGLQGVVRLILPTLSVWMIRVSLLLLLRLAPAGAAVDLTLYGGAFDSSSIIAHAEVVQTCFGGLEVGSCEPSSPNWLFDFLEQYNHGTSGVYCASCCSNTDVSGDTWTFTCPLIATAFAEFVNKFGWEFRFGRRETIDDKEVITCPIPRSACLYDEDDALSAPCESDGSFLAGYVLTLEVMTIERGVSSWKSVQSCSVETQESATQPEQLAETIIMAQVYAGDSGIETGWAVFIALVALFVLSCGVRYARDDRCTICGHHLIWFRRVCLPCNFFGYVAPSKEVAEIIQDKRSVILPEPTLSERIGTVKASTTKVFVQATERAIPAGTLLKISSIRSGTSRPSSTKGVVGAGRGGVDVAEKGFESTRRGGSSFGSGVRRSKGGLPVLPSARSVTFIGDIVDESPPHSQARGKSNVRRGKRSSRVVAPQVAAPDGSTKNGNSSRQDTGGTRASSKPKPLKRSPDWT